MPGDGQGEQAPAEGRARPSLIVAGLLVVLVLVGGIFYVVSSGISSDDDGVDAAMTSTDGDADPAPGTSEGPASTTTSVAEEPETWHQWLSLEIGLQLQMSDEDMFDVPPCIVDELETELGAGRLEEVVDQTSGFAGDDRPDMVEMLGRPYLPDVLDTDEWQLVVDSANECLDDFMEHVVERFADSLLDAGENGEIDETLTPSEAECVGASVMGALGAYDTTALVFGSNGDESLTAEEGAAFAAAFQACA